MRSCVANSALAAGLYYAAAAAAQGTACSQVIVPSYSAPVVASGWQAQLVAGGLTKPRSMQFDSTGALLVVESGKGISRHRFTDNGGTCLASNHSHMIVELPELNHGLALSKDGRTLYASSAEAVYAWTYDARGGSVSGERRTLVANMSNNDLITRTLLVSQKQDGVLLVSRGSAETDMAQTTVMSNGLSQIRAFNLSNLTDGSSVYNFNADGRVLGWGLRNSVGVAEHPVSGGVYAVENSVDGVTRNGQDVHENNPGEELNFLGVLGEDQQGGPPNFGYPHCFAVWEAREIPANDELSVGKQFAIQEDNALTDEVCASNFTAPRLTFPAHYAPIDIKFTPDGATAYVSFRGSFDRSSPVGYRIASISFNPSTGEPVAAADSTDALADVLTNPDLGNCPDGCFRPAGLALDGDGRLWMTSDSTGEIYVLQRTGDGAGRFVTPGGGSTSGAVARTGGRWEKEMVAWSLVVGIAALLAWC